MQVTSTLTANQLGAQSVENPDAKKSTAGDFETFLTLLTTQMRNQDPLKPMDSTAFVAQLASFSSVEQQIKTNTYLESLLGAVANNSGNGISDWIGKEVRHTGASNFNGQPKTVAVSVNPDADSAYLVVHNAYGDEVDRMPISPTATNVLWPATPETSPPFGTYSYSVESLSGDQIILESAAHVYDMVNEIRIGSDQKELVVEGGIVVPVANVDAIRTAQT